MLKRKKTASLKYILDYENSRKIINLTIETTLKHWRNYKSLYFPLPAYFPVFYILIKRVKYFSINFKIYKLRAPAMNTFSTLFAKVCSFK